MIKVKTQNGAKIVLECWQWENIDQSGYVVLANTCSEYIHDEGSPFASKGLSKDRVSLFENSESGGGDGNGIYDGDGTIPSGGALATLSGGALVLFLPQANQQSTDSPLLIIRANTGDDETKGITFERENGTFLGRIYAFAEGAGRMSIESEGDIGAYAAANVIIFAGNLAANYIEFAAGNKFWRILGVGRLKFPQLDAPAAIDAGLFFEKVALPINAVTHRFKYRGEIGAGGVWPTEYTIATLEDLAGNTIATTTRLTGAGTVASPLDLAPIETGNFSANFALANQLFCISTTGTGGAVTINCASMLLNRIYTVILRSSLPTTFSGGTFVRSGAAGSATSITDSAGTGHYQIFKHVSTIYISKFATI